MAVDELARRTGLELVWVHVGALGRPARRAWSKATLQPHLRVVASTRGELLLAVVR